MLWAFQIGPLCNGNSGPKERQKKQMSESERRGGEAGGSATVSNTRGRQKGMEEE